MANSLTKLRYRHVPDHLFGEVLSKPWIDNAVPFIALIATLGTFMALQPSMFSAYGLVDLSRQLAEFGLLVVALTVVMISGGIDLAIDSGAEDGALEPAFLHKVDALAEWLRAQPKVTKVLSVVDLVKDVRRAWFPEQAEGYRIPDTAPGVAQSLASYTVATPRKNEVDSWMDEDKRRVRLNVLWTLSGSKRVSARVDEVRAKAAELGLDADVTGKTVLMTGMNQAIVSTYFGSILSALALVSLLLVVLLRSLKLGALAMVPNVIAPAVGAALLVLIGQPIDIGTVLVSSVCLGIAVDDTIHFLIDYRRWREQGLAVEPALREVLAGTGPALIATTGVLALSFATFAAASFTPNVHFGLLTVVVMLVALAADLILLPALLLVLPGGNPEPAPSV